MIAPEPGQYCEACGQALLAEGSIYLPPVLFDLDLTPTERRLLTYMYQRLGSAVSDEQLLRDIWHLGREERTRAQYTHAMRLNVKLAGTGYKLIRRPGFGLCLAPE